MNEQTEVEREEVKARLERLERQAGVLGDPDRKRCKQEMEEALERLRRLERLASIRHDKKDRW